MSRQAIAFGSGGPIFVNEALVRQGILADALFINDTVPAPTPPSPPPPPAAPSGGGGRRKKGLTYYDRLKRVILPNGERVEIATQEEYFRLMDDLIAGTVPEAVEEHPAPSAKQIAKARKKVQQAALKLDVPAALIEQRIAEQIATHRVETEKRIAGYPVTRVTLRTKRLAPTLRDQMEWAEVARLVREAIAAEDDEEEAFMQMVAGLL